MAINDPFGTTNDGTQMPALSMFVVTPADSDLPTVIRSLYVGVGGNISLQDTQGNIVTHVGVASGSYLGPFRVARVRATNTTATSMIGYV